MFWYSNRSDIVQDRFVILFQVLDDWIRIIQTDDCNILFDVNKPVRCRPDQVPIEFPAVDWFQTLHGYEEMAEM